MTGSVSNSEIAGAVGSDRNRLAIGAVLIGALAGMIVVLLAGQAMQRAVFDTWQRLAPRDVGADNVAVVLIDDASVEAEGSWPWPRYLVARLIETIGEARPAAIGVDIYFTEPDPLRPEAFAGLYLEEELNAEARAQVMALPNFDLVLADVISRHPVVLARFADDAGQYAGDELFYNSTVEGEAPDGAMRAQAMVASTFDIDGAALSHAMVNGPPDSDGVVRRVPLAVGVGEMQAPGFALELARVASGAEVLRWDGQSMRVDGRAVPADRSGAMALHMGTFPPEQVYSASAVARGAVDPAAFAGKVVLVGVGATGTFDIVATPLASEAYGVLVQAQAVDAILESGWLARPTWAVWAEWSLAALLVLLILAAARLRQKGLLIAALAIALALPFASFASFAAFSGGGLLLSPVAPLLVAGFAALAFGVARFVTARAQLVEERVAASQTKGELEAARRIQMSMVPSNAALARLDPRAQIGAVLEPAKSVGGDFFDAVRIGEDELLFLVGDVTGKGVPAALFMALSKTLSKSNLARAKDGLEEAVCALNRELMEEADEEMGLTMLAGVIDCTSGAVQMVNAGHENPLLVRTDGSVETVAMRGGPPFCVIDFPYEAEALSLGVGETLVIITDGATEAANPSNALFGVEGVTRALVNAENGTAPESAAHLAQQVRLFEGSSDPSDDLTILALRYLG